MASWKTAHSLFERHRHEQKSEKLWTEIKLVIDKFAPAFTQLLQASSDVSLTKRDLDVRFPTVFDDVLSNERSRSSVVKEYLRCNAVDDKDLLRSDRLSKISSIFFFLYWKLRLGFTRIFWRSSDRIHDVFSHTTLLRQCQTAFDSSWKTILPLLRSDLFDLDEWSGHLGSSEDEDLSSCSSFRCYVQQWFRNVRQQYALTIWSLLTRLNLSPTFDDITSSALIDRISVPLLSIVARRYTDEVSLDLSRE